MKNRIRIESDENIVTNAKIIYIEDDGREVDISRCVQGVDLHLRIGEISRASIHAILVDGKVTADIEEILLRHFKFPKRRWYHHWLNRDSVEVTNLTSRTRCYLPGLRE